ncbi:ABC transporter related protein [Xylanimonas cellulosilytica DSM 15894]|uniref:ABC transporter related protein n=1 Tax=Xylanimonas cellulosilytica (strain DSM 15894 / JCM 12276 / CECT 5975 / KCTC 9989 / LMG 20990 / NBRC 107835 / XIL07) TaxID=446471 RepID=D1BT83_XYLCX|nr:ABC transporter ATP-binding protein [Xylanimonas cellulosilytica]ACZ30925.1 ABC transporter related protein [Xylanimonas cellulosilytica DSM 15894]
MPTPALRISGLRKEYPSRDGTGPVVAVDGIDVEVAPGEIVAFLGPNGAGKTTTLDIVLGLNTPTDGVVEVLGTTPRKAMLAGHVSAVLQTEGLLRDLKVGETVRVIAALHGVEDRVGEVMERTGLTPLAQRKVQSCSGGEQQRLRFALALLPDPQLLVLDEPTAGMDAAARRDFWETMRAETHAGRTVIFATHYLEEAQSFAPRTVLIDGGRIRADRPTDELREMVGDRVVAATVPPADALAVLAAVRAVPGVREARADGARLVVHGTASDDVARLLLTTTAAVDLEVSAPSLEAAFFALTEESRK